MDFTNVIDNAKRFAGKRQKGDSYDDLLIDRLHNRYTVAVLVCFCIAVSTYQFAGQPLECWVPAQFNGNYEDYTNLLCYIQNTYHVPRHEIIPKDPELRRERTLKYYQWINFVLLLQALCFSLPRIIWQSFNDRIGISIGNLVDVSNECESYDDENNRNKVIQYISDCLERYQEYVSIAHRPGVSLFERVYRRFRLFCHARTGASLACLYIFIRILYILNLILQILFLQYFLSYHDINYIEYGFNVFKKLLSDFSLPESRLFPRITLCDFQIRELGERHKYTVECILVINIFIEKLYFLLWLWLAILLIITIFHTIHIIHQIFFRHSRNLYLAQHLELIPGSHLARRKEFRYYRRCFPIDNLFALWVISANSNSLIIAEIIDELFQRKLRDGSEI
ncbi:unnamed protein product [Rotaria socialis]|uniref:Innexin n=1 Tax=Rotaria socialis TaxID=392032 RepID=A0A820GNR0_9BILA|nr:unnamed protein product [Rotaria socialis]CAF4413477.1 unnamed protein product [Rotaria socialis]